MQPNELAQKLLESMGRPDETAFYLRLFQSHAGQRFAALELELPVLQARGALIVALRVLDTLGLRPLLLVGLWAKRGSTADARSLARALKKQGIASRTRVITSTQSLPRVSTVPAEALPIIAFDETWQSVSETSRTRWCARLLHAMSTRKMVILRPEGALSYHGKSLNIVNLSQEFQSLIKSKELGAEGRRWLRRGQVLLTQGAMSTLVISLASPITLLRELFTTKGAGTLIRVGTDVHRYNAWDGRDHERLARLFGASFGKELSDRFFQQPVSHIYLETHYRGVAVVRTTSFGSYLTKWAVEPLAQGEGVGRDVWDAMSAEHPSLFWRARPGNPTNAWYIKVCEAMVRTAKWNIYFIGLAVGSLADAINFAISQPEDFQSDHGLL